MPALAHILPFEGMSIWPLYILDERKKCPTCPILLKATVQRCENEEGFLPGQALRCSLGSQHDQKDYRHRKETIPSADWDIDRLFPGGPRAQAGSPHILK